MTLGLRIRTRSSEVGCEQVQAEHLRLLLLVLRVTREVDQVADQAGELLELLDDVGEQRLALVVGDQVGVGEDLDVGADARDRRAQFVRCIGDELALRAQRSSSASSIWLKLRASAASSSWPPASIRRLRSRVDRDLLGRAAKLLDRAQPPHARRGSRGRRRG